MALLARRSAASSTSSPGGKTGPVRFAEAEAGPARIKPAQPRFAELALRFHRLREFMIIEVAGPSPCVRLP